MKPIVRQGLIAPATVAAVALFAWSIAGSGVALLLIALGASAIIGFHLWQLQRIADWAAASLDAEVPEGRGEWRPLFAAIYRRMRVRVASPCTATAAGSGITSCAAGASTHPCFATSPPIVAGRL